jgi:hypothetical protein
VVKDFAYWRNLSAVNSEQSAFVLLHTENFPDYAAARMRERFLKSGRGREWLHEKYPKRR